MRRAIVIAIVATTAIAVFLVAKSTRVDSSSHSRLPSPSQSTSASWSHSQAAHRAAGKEPAVASPQMPRQQFREAKDYAQLVTELGPLAADGNVEAQYVIAEALRWCDRTLHLYFIRPNGQVRSLEDAQAQRASRPAGISSDYLATIDRRCHGFLEDPDRLKSVASWNEWLNNSASANYPPAMAMQADLLMEKSTLSSQQGATPAGADDHAQNIALQALQSGDPDAIFLMSNWVRQGTRTAEETSTLISAWQILACQKGYDCGSDSDFMHTVCDWDAQCADGRSYTEYFQRQLGTQYDDALALAKTLGELIAGNDTQGIRSYL